MIPAELVNLIHDRLKRSLVAVGDVLAARRQLAPGQQRFERNATARDAALDRADRTAADFGRFFIGESARTDEDQRLSLRLG